MGHAHHVYRPSKREYRPVTGVSPFDDVTMTLDGETHWFSTPCMNDAWLLSADTLAKCSRADSCAMRSLEKPSADIRSRYSSYERVTRVMTS